MKLIKTTLATGIAAALALGVAGQANASVYASSSLQIRDFKVAITADDVTKPIVANPIQSFEFNLTNTATLNGSNVIESGNCSGTLALNTCGGTPSLDAAPANAPGGSIVRANNDFSFFGPGVNTYANSDSVIDTSELGDGVPSSTRQIAESELQGTGNASSNAEIKSNTGFKFVFSVADGTASLKLSFDADPSLYAEINQLSFISGAAQANLNASFSLTKNDGSAGVNWTPNGNATNDCTVDGPASLTCSEDADNIDLNRNISVSSNPALAQYSRAAGWSLMGITVAGIGAGDWTLAFNAVTSSSVRTVPEPSALALLGIAIAGMGAVSRRRKLA